MSIPEHRRINLKYHRSGLKLKSIPIFGLNPYIIT